MSTAVVVSSPVIIAPQQQEHPVVVHKSKLVGIGITEILIGLYALGIGFYYVHVLNTFEPRWNTNPALYVEIVTGVWFILSGALAVYAAIRPTECNITGGKVIAILASMAAFGVMIKEALETGAIVLYCRLLECEPPMGPTVAIGILAVLTFVEFILAIVHASYSCICCCGHSNIPTSNAAITMNPTAAPAMRRITAPGKGYVAFDNPQDQAMAYAPQPTQAKNDQPPQYY